MGLALRGGMRSRWRLPLLQLLLLLGVFLRQLLSLLLMPLLHLLCSVIIGFLFRQLLVLLVLLLLKFLPFLVLLRGQLVLLLLVFLVELGVSGIGSSSARGRREFFRVNRRVGVIRVFRAAIVKFSRPRSRSDWGLAMIGGSAQRRVLTRGVHVRRLCGDGSDVPLVCGCFFLPRRAIVDSAMAVIADAYIVSHIHLRFVHVVNHGHVYVGHCAVVEEMAVVPTPAFKTVAEVSEAIVDAAVETYCRSPIAGIPDKTAAAPAPVARRPEKPTSGASTHVPGTQ